MIPSVSQYAGQQPLTGQQAEAYADHFIAQHMVGQYAVDYDHCTGCALCAAECPCGAIDMEPEQT